MSLFPKFLPCATPATAATRMAQSSGNSESSKGEPVDWITRTSPASATMPFNQEAMDAIQRGQAVPVWSDLLGEWLYWVRGEAERKRLLADGGQAPICTLGELAEVVQHDPKDIKKLHLMKRTFNGVIGQEHLK